MKTPAPVTRVRSMIVSLPGKGLAAKFLSFLWIWWRPRKRDSDQPASAIEGK
jgi:hypothetical protein